MHVCKCMCVCMHVCVCINACVCIVCACVCIYVCVCDCVGVIQGRIGGGGGLWGLKTPLQAQLVEFLCSRSSLASARLVVAKL